MAVTNCEIKTVDVYRRVEDWEANFEQLTKITDCRQKILDCGPRTVHCRLQTVHGGLTPSTSDLCLWTVDRGLRAANWKVWTVDFGLRTTDFGLTGTDCGYVLSSVMKVSPTVVMTSIDEYLGKCLIHNSIKLSMFAHSFSSYLLTYLKWMWLKKRIGRRPEGLETSVL